MGATGVVCGDIVYADDSSLAAAAVHAALLSVGESKCIRDFVLGSYKGFVSSVREDIESFSSVIRNGLAILLLCLML
jgi:hypothetical protein